MIAAPVRSSLKRVELDRLGCLEECDPAAGDDALLERGSGSLEGVLDAVLLLLHLGLGRSADLDHRDATRQLREALLELLAVEVGVVFSTSAFSCLTRPLIASRATRRRPRSWSSPCRSRSCGPCRAARASLSSLRPISSVITSPPVRIAMSSSIRLRRSTEARRLDGDGGEHAAELSDDDRRERLALDVLARPRSSGRRWMTCSSTGRRSLTAPIFRFAIRTYGSSSTGLHALGVGDHVRRQVALSNCMPSVNSSSRPNVWPPRCSRRRPCRPSRSRQRSCCRSRAHARRSWRRGRCPPCR